MNYEVFAQYDSFSRNINEQEIERLYLPLKAPAEFGGISFISTLRENGNLNPL